MCNCGRSSSGTGAAPSPVRAANAPAASPAFVALKYRGARALLVRGPVTGVGYACYPGGTIRASPRDAEPLVASGVFFVARARSRDGP
jgi:hypothetical protein